MTFYQAMQLGTYNLKALIKEAQDEKLKRKYIAALVVKDILCILFCMMIVILFSTIFGQENSIVGVVTVLALLTFRFSNLDFDVKQSAITILGIFGILIVGPYIASTVNPIIGSIINFISIMAIVVLSCHNVQNLTVYTNRIFGLIFGGLIVAGIFYYKQRNANFENKFSDIIKDIDFSTERTKWQLKLSIGICSAILIGELIHLPRTMWIGIACMSILQPTKDKIDFRYKNRPIFLTIGCLMFGVVYVVLPQEFRGYIGIAGGLILGLCGSYQWQTVFNCFGALVAAVPMLGLWNAVILRILNNVFGAIYIKFFNNIFDKIDEKISNKNVVDEIVEG